MAGDPLQRCRVSPATTAVLAGDTLQRCRVSPALSLCTYSRPRGGVPGESSRNPPATTAVGAETSSVCAPRIVNGNPPAVTILGAQLDT